MRYTTALALLFATGLSGTSQSSDRQKGTEVGDPIKVSEKGPPEALVDLIKIQPPDLISPEMRRANLEKTREVLAIVRAANKTKLPRPECKR